MYESTMIEISKNKKKIPNSIKIILPLHIFWDKVPLTKN